MVERSLQYLYFFSRQPFGKKQPGTAFCIAKKGTEDGKTFMGSIHFLNRVS